MKTFRYFLFVLCMITSISLIAQNNILKGKVFYLSSDNKPAIGVHIKEKDSSGDYSKDNGEYRLVFQKKRNGDALALEVGTDNGEGKKIELVNEKEVKVAKLPAKPDDNLDIIVCFAGERDFAAQKYYHILRTTADKELEKKKKEVEGLMAQKEKDYQRISDLFAQIDKMQQALDSAKIREQAFYIASINLDRASQLIKEAVKKMDEENDVEEALMVLKMEVLDTLYEKASAEKKNLDETIKQVILGYELRISLLEAIFDYKEVAICYEKLILMHEKEKYGREELVEIIFHASNYWGLAGDYQKQLDLNLKAKLIIEKFTKNADLSLGTVYNNLALAYINLGDYLNALVFIKKASLILEKELSNDHSDLAIIYKNTSLIYRELDQKLEAIDYIQKAIKIMEKIIPEGKPDLAVYYDDFALLLTIYTRDQEAALLLHKKAIAIKEKNLPNNHPGLAKSYHSIALTYEKLDSNKMALAFNQNALSIREKILPSYHPDLATSYSYTGSSYNKLRDYPNALVYHHNALDIRKKVLHPSHVDLGVSYNDLFVTYSALGQDTLALDYALNTKDIFEKTFTPNHKDLAIFYNNLAGVYNNLGEFQNQLEYNLKALTICNNSQSMDIGSIIKFHSDIAISYSNLCEYPKALEYNLKAIALLEKILPLDDPAWASFYSNLGRAYRDVGNIVEGVNYGQKAVNFVETGQYISYIVHRFYSNLGITYAKAREFEKAKTLLEKSEKLNTEERVYRAWAIYYALLKQKEKAIDNLQKAVALGFKYLKWLETEPDLKNIRKEKGYLELVEKLKK